MIKNRLNDNKKIASFEKTRKKRFFYLCTHFYFILSRFYPKLLIISLKEYIKSLNFRI